MRSYDFRSACGICRDVVVACQVSGLWVAMSNDGAGHRVLFSALTSDNMSLRGTGTISAEGEPLVNVREVRPA